MDNSVPFNHPVQSSVSHGLCRPIGKLILLIALPAVMIISGVIFLKGYFSQKISQQNTGKDILAVIPMQDTNWQDLGTVFEPVVPLKIKTNEGFKENKFLLDSGAVISSLPREWAKETGQDLAFLPRTTFRGFGNTESFAYQGNMVVLLGENEMTLPVVFTEAAGTRSLLGRKGFFETNSILFDHKNRQIEILK